MARMGNDKLSPYIGQLATCETCQPPAISSPYFPQRMSGSSRHMACKTCRDRKVRCGGEQPTCEKCRRSGETCLYVSPSKQSKVDLAQTIESLQERLAKAEAQLQESKCAQSTQSDHVVFDHINAISAQPPYSSPAMNFIKPRPQSSSFTENMHTSSTSYSEGASQMSDFMALVSPLPTMSPSCPDVPESNAFMESLLPLVNPTTSHGARSPEWLSLQPSHFPSLHDLRALNANPSPQQQQPCPAEAITTKNGSNNMPHLVEELGTFSSAVLLTQADIAGMASTLAEYLVWTRRLAHPNLAMVRILETLEARAREIASVASSNPRASFEHMVNELGDSEVVANLRNVEKKLDSRISEVSGFFQSTYDIRSPLAAQRGS